MKITFVSPCADLSGGFRVVTIHAERLQKRGHDVTIVCPPRPAPTLRQRVRSLIDGRGWSHSTLSHKVNVSHRVLERTRPVVDGDVPDADVVVATWWETAEWVAKLSPRKGAKAYFIQHHEVFDYLPKDRVTATYRLPFHKITISKWLLELMASTYGDSGASLVRNSVDSSQFFADPRDKQPVPTVGFLYSTVYWKGLRTTFAAIQQLRRSFPNLRIVAFGAEPPSQDLPLPEKTEYLRVPPQDEIRNTYSRCDLWLCGSDTEGFHLPPLEAMACRCPVASTAVGGPIDVIENGINGYIVPVGDYSALADRAGSVLSLNNDGWRSMSEAAYRTATRYTWDDASELLERALRLAMERSNTNRLSSRARDLHPQSPPALAV